MEEGLLPVVLKYRCRLLFTTRSRFDEHTFMDLEEISDRETLLRLMECFYTDAKRNHPILEEMIRTVHSHTLAVELSARLLETGIMEPEALLNKLKEEKTAMDATDTIGITKDGRSRKATYYDHLHTLFSLYHLADEEFSVMRSLSLIPHTGISGRMFANWMKLEDMNIINGLIEKGFVQAKMGACIALHPMIQEIAVEETKPSVLSCRTLLESIQAICLSHGEDVSYYKQVSAIAESVMDFIAVDDTEFYLRFLEDVFPFMEKYHEIQGKERILHHLSAMLADGTAGSFCDRALLLEYQAVCEEKPQKAIRLQKEALSVISEITQENALLVSNLYANLGRFYKQNGQLESARQSMEQALLIMEQYGLLHYHDSIVQIMNYAVLLTDMGQPDKGLSALRKLSRILREFHLENNMDYAKVQEALGGICLTVGEVKQATTHFKRALAVYEVLFEAEPEMVEVKKQELLETYTQAGFQLGNRCHDFCQ
jgi:tetratricopeptide (TPR) repeat protein